MARKVIGLAVGRQGSTRRRWTLLLSLVVAVGAGAVFIQPLLAVHDDGFFELDRNTEDTGTAGEDWNTIYAASPAGGGLGTTAANAFAFIQDNAGGANDTSIATGGGTKDDLDIPGWEFTTGNPVDKDDLLSGYAARYGDHLYFGADRYAGNGSAQMGIWFFQEEVAPDPANPGHFIGEHTDGDVLVLSDFVNGGAATNIRVFQWEAGGPINGTLRLIAGTADIPADCIGFPPKIPGVAAGDPFCATVNVANVNVPWPFFPKGAKGNPPPGGFAVPPGQLYEGGIDLAFLNLDDQCFSSFMIETRSSPSVDAVLKDFVGGGFESCETTLSTTASRHGATNTIIGGPGSDSGTISSGTDTAVLTIDGVENWSGDLKFYICGPFAAPALCTASGVLVDTKTVNQSSPLADFTSDVGDAVTLTSVGRYCWFVTFTPDQATADKGVESAAHDGSGDANNEECFTVSPAAPTLLTAAVASNVSFGQQIQDNATVSNLAKEPGTNGTNTTYPSIGATNGVWVGSIVFSLTGPDSCSAVPSGFTNITVQIAPNAGNAQYGPVSFTPTAPGTYSWKAQYQAGGAVNTQSSTVHNTLCNETAENVVVAQIPTDISTTPFGYPQDTAVVKAKTGNVPAGSVVFRLYDSLANCKAAGDTVGQGGLLFKETKSVTGGQATETLTTNNTNVKIDSPGNNGNPYYWTVVFTPTGTTHTSRSSTCAENTSMTHTPHAFQGFD